MDYLYLKLALTLGLTLGLYYLPLLRRWRKYVLLAGSCGFLLSVSPWTIVWLLAAALVTYFCALQVRSEKGTFYYWLGVIFPLLLLGYFKYTNFFASFFHAKVVILAGALGVSFYSFRIISYLTDVKRGILEAEKDFAALTLYLAFFPQIICGPIERSQSFLSQQKEPIAPSVLRFHAGFEQILWGLFKKLVVADNLATLVNPIFDNVASYSGFAYVLATLGYTFQIYCDFSGYSDMAIGMARLFGIDLADNFRVPYAASGFKDFWGRWHISLSTWFRDYVYIPLGGGRCSKLRSLGNIFVTFLLSGFWHGANWTFIIWGGLHGVFLGLERLLIGKRAFAAKKGFQIFWGVVTFVCVTVAWIFFRANSLPDACSVCGGLFVGMASPLSYFHQGFTKFFAELGPFELVRLLLPLAFLIFFEWRYRNESPWLPLAQAGGMKRFLFYVFCLLVIVLFHAGEPQQMIYGQF